MAQPWTERRTRPEMGPAAIFTAWFGDLAITGTDLKKARRWLVATGILGVIGGLVAIFVPAVATLTIAIFIGWVLTFAGVVMAVQAWTQRGAGRSWERPLMALLTLAVGIYMLLFPVDGAVSLTLLLIVWFAGSGVLALLAARRLRLLPGTGFLAFNGVVSLVLAILIAVDLPSSASWAIGLLVGVNLVFWGLRTLVAASLLKRIARA
jgi:uncharacterized membrane protein HdeD (DUF308 family)